MSERLWLTRAAVVLTAIFAAAGYTASPALAGTGQSNGTTMTYTASPGEQNQVVISRPGGSGTPWIIDDSGVIGSIVAASGCSVATSTELSCPDPGNTVSRFQALTGNMDDRVAIDGSVTSLSSGVLVDGGDGINTIDYSNQFSGVTVDLGAGQATEPNGNVDTLANIQNIDGSSLGDTLVGDANPNVINGQGGSDTIAGGGGGDTLSGGAGTDTVSYGAVGGPEHIDLAAGTATGDGTDTLSSFEAALGSPFADTMTPSNSGSELDGGFGNDTFVSGPGDDTIDGGSGNDTIDYSAASGPINADLGGGSASGDGSDTIVPNSVENLTGSPFADTLAGDANNNVLSGGGGNDVLAGRGGNDTLDGGGGTNTASYAPAAAGVDVNLRAGSAPTDGDGASDTLLNIQNVTGSAQDDTIEGDDGHNVIDGGGGNDTVSYSGAAGSVFVDLGAGSSTGDGADTLSSIRNATGSNYADTLIVGSSGGVLSGGPGNDTLTGGTGDDVLNGGAGDDTLSGAGGNDTLSGGDGNDTLSGGADDGVTGDTMDGGSGSNTVDYSSATSAVTVLLATAGPQNTGGGGLDTLTGVQNVTGSPFADSLTGDGNDNTLSGGGGNDVLNGEGGDDTLVGGSGNDTASFADGSAVDANLATGEADGQGTDSLSGIENLTGSANNDTLTGNAANNILGGGLGNDTLDGGPGQDTLTGGGGADTADYSNALAGVTVNLSAGTATGYGSDTLSGISNVTGSSFDDSITGDGNANGLSGGGGADTIVGGLGSDTVSGGLGNDKINVKDGVPDTVTCGPGSDAVTADSIDTIAADCEVPAGKAPTATTGAATPNITTATLRGTVNAHGKPTTYFFQWGKTQSYGSSSNPSSAGSGTIAVPFSTVAKGLKANTTYHFRIVATSPSGTSFGLDKTFKTK